MNVAGALDAERQTLIHTLGGPLFEGRTYNFMEWQYLERSGCCNKAKTNWSKVGLNKYRKLCKISCKDEYFFWYGLHGSKHHLVHDH